MGNKNKPKAKANEGQHSGKWTTCATPTSKKGAIWKQAPVKFVPEVPKVPNETNTWIWPSLDHQKTQAGGKSANTAKKNPAETIDNPIETAFAQRSFSDTFVLRYYTNNSVPARGSIWEHPPLPGTANFQASSDPDPAAWSTVPENAKWSTLPAYAINPALKSVEVPWCTKKRAITILTPAAPPNPDVAVSAKVTSPPATKSPWATVPTNVAFPTPPEQENPNDAVANLDWGLQPTVLSEKDAIAANAWDDGPVATEPEPFPNLVNWPFTGEKDRFKRVASLGPFVFNWRENVFKHPKHNQAQSTLIRVLQIEGIDVILLRFIWENHSNASALCRTSQRSWEVAMAITGIWDMTGGCFEGCDAPIEGNEFDGRASSVVVVTPTRDTDPINYVTQIKNLNKMCMAMHNFSEFLQNIQLHHIPFLTTHILALVIPEIRKLKTLGVYNCELIHLGDGIELLDIITRDRLRGCEHQVDLDFYPVYHVGPHPFHQAGDHKGERRLGGEYSYGVTWDDPGMHVADIRIAIWQEVHSLLRQARAQGIDFVSKHTMFRQWLDKSPCMLVEETLKILMDDNVTVDHVIAHVAYGDFGGRVEKYHEALKGRGIANKTEGVKWMEEGFLCCQCGHLLPGVWFSYQMIRNYKLDPIDQPVCQACKLFQYLNQENDHYKLEKLTIIKAWCWERTSNDPRHPGKWNTNDIGKFLDAFKSTPQGSRIRGLARNLHDKRRLDEAHDIFHEIDEVQRPISSQALGRRGAYGIRAATVQDKLWIESGRKHSEWDSFRVDRINGHGVPATFRGHW
ncbi:uncharacterized protein EAE97_000945 [Botrytis byssoidea]|uniref:Uncharacterized protein n=1 Tax=Botrytis byssoidea TaxID=139641 RepID=A0A9P5ITH7_9HELO|nr:uncharacterized protein EAE97_000945 [Botrytis byssoidea]KAF7953546.1 hypothetical protein EAE97_000945 [Botrytis byssoidea]